MDGWMDEKIVGWMDEQIVVQTTNSINLTLKTFPKVLEKLCF